METNTLLFIVIVFFSSLVLVTAAYYEYKLKKCNYTNTQLSEKPKSIFETEPILTQDTNLENQFDDSPYSIYKDYFDQPSPWVGTQWSHPGDSSTSKY
jgi:hypothetical protein